MDNPIAAENSCPGTQDWRPNHPRGDVHAIEAFAAPSTVNIGEQVKLYVSTSASTYTLQVYRLGWYGGAGGRLVYSAPSVLKGIKQPQCLFEAGKRMVDCRNWHDPVAVPVAATWVSGFYIVKLVSSADKMRYSFFVVRNDASQSPYLFQVGIFTYQAYNTWGGYSLYFGQNPPGKVSDNEPADRTKRSYTVSFDRPYGIDGGLGDFLRWDYPLLRWMERTNHNMSYTTDVDTDMRSGLLSQHQVMVMAGHDEYWSTAMRTHVSAARDAGLSLAFMGANDAYWHVRLADSPLGPERRVICYRYMPEDPLAATHPQEATVRWRNAPQQPENALIGQMFAGIVENGPYPLVLGNGAQPFLQDTVLKVGSSIPGLVGGEYDRVVSNGLTPGSLTMLTSSQVHCSLALCPRSGVDSSTSSIYTAASGAKVFDAGTLLWSWGLDDDAPASLVKPHSYSSKDFQQFTENIFTYLLAR